MLAGNDDRRRVIDWVDRDVDGIDIGKRIVAGRITGRAASVAIVVGVDTALQ